MANLELRAVVRDSRLVRAVWPAAVIGAAFAQNLYVSWLKWGDPVIDGGREWMMPLRMLQGEVLYTEHRNIYGPLAPYLNMLLYKIFGVHLSVLQAAEIVSAAMMTMAIFLLARRFLERLPSVAMAVTFPLRLRIRASDAEPFL